MLRCCFSLFIASIFASAPRVEPAVAAVVQNPIGNVDFGMYYSCPMKDFDVFLQQHPPTPYLLCHLIEEGLRQPFDGRQLLTKSIMALGKEPMILPAQNIKALLRLSVMNALHVLTIGRHAPWKTIATLVRHMLKGLDDELHALDGIVSKDEMATLMRYSIDGLACLDNFWWTFLELPAIYCDLIRYAIIYGGLCLPKARADILRERADLLQKAIQVPETALAEMLSGFGAHLMDSKYSSYVRHVLYRLSPDNPLIPFIDGILGSSSGQDLVVAFSCMFEAGEMNPAIKAGFFPGLHLAIQVRSLDEVKYVLEKLHYSVAQQLVLRMVLEGKFRVRTKYRDLFKILYQATQDYRCKGWLEVPNKFKEDLDKFDIEKFVFSLVGYTEEQLIIEFETIFACLLIPLQMRVQCCMYLVQPWLFAKTMSVAQHHKLTHLRYLCNFLGTSSVAQRYMTQWEGSVHTPPKGLLHIIQTAVIEAINHL